MRVFYNVQTTNLTFVVKKTRFTIDSYNIAKFQIVISSTKYDIWCSRLLPVKGTAYCSQTSLQFPSSDKYNIQCALSI